MASSSDFFKKVGLPGNATTLAAPGHTIGGTSFTVVSTSLWPTDTGVTFAIDTTTLVNGVTTRVPGSYTVWDGVVTSGTTITGGILRYGTDQNYPAGSTTRVYILPTSVRENKIVDGLLAAGITQAGGMGAISPTSINSSGAITGTTITGTSGVFNTITVGSQTPSADWTGTTTPNTVTALGNRSYSMVFNATDLTGAINPGTRLRTTRTVAAPTQSTSLNGTTQYWVKTSPNKLTFTDDFVVSAWIKLTSYAGGVIMSRYNGTSGWIFNITSTGQILLTGYNASISNSSSVQSVQSVPLNKWVHVTAQLDMSAFTATTTTSYVMIDGVDVPATVARAGTNPTALIQAGNLEIGSFNGGAGGSFFLGKIGQSAIYNAKVTQATILTSISQGLSGTETSLASAYSFNGVATDLNTTTPNDLSVGGGSAVATNADSPFGGQASGLISSTLDYGIVQSSSFSTNTTLVVEVPEGCTIPTSGGVNAVSYSSVKAPYGMPTQGGKWQISAIYISALIQSSPTANTVYNISNAQIYLPIGTHNVIYKGSLFHDGTNAPGESHLSFTKASATYISSKLTSTSYIGVTTGLIALHRGEDSVTVSVAAPVYVNSTFNSAGTTMQWYAASINSQQYGGLFITADNPYV